MHCDNCHLTKPGAGSGSIEFLDSTGSNPYRVKLSIDKRGEAVAFCDDCLLLLCGAAIIPTLIAAGVTVEAEDAMGIKFDPIREQMREDAIRAQGKLDPRWLEKSMRQQEERNRRN